MERVGGDSSTTGTNNRRDDAQSSTSPLSNGHASQQHSSLSDRKAKDQKGISSTENKKAPLRIRLSRTKDTTAAAPTKSPAKTRPLQDDTDVDSLLESKYTQSSSLSGSRSKDEQSRAQDGNSTLLAGAEAKREAGGYSTRANKGVSPLLCTEALDSTVTSSTCLPARTSKLHAPKGASVKRDSHKSSTATYARASSSISSSSPDAGRKRRRNRQKNKSPTPTPTSPTAFSAVVYASLAKPSPSKPSPSTAASGGAVKKRIEKKKTSKSLLTSKHGTYTQQRNNPTARGAPSQVVKSSTKEVKVSRPYTEAQGKKIPNSNISQEASPSHVGKSVVKKTETSSASGVSALQKLTTPSVTSPSTATTSQESLLQKPIPTDDTGPSPVTEASRAKEVPSSDSPRKPSPLELVKIRAQKKLEHELSLLVSGETLPSPGMDTDTKVGRNEVTDMELELPEESTFLRHESWKKLQELDNASVEKRVVAARAARLALRKESHAYSKSVVMKLQNQGTAPLPVFVERAPNSSSLAGGTWRSAATSGAFISTTPSASSAYVTTNGSRLRATQESIRRAIPSSASSVVHVMDRRVNLDACAPDASYYSLLRAWVQDDPCRQIPPPGSNIFESVSLSTGIPEERNVDIVLPKKRKIEATETTCNVLDSLVNPSEPNSVPLLTSLRDQLVTNGKRRRREKRREEKVWMNAARANLKSMGIELPEAVSS